MILDEEDYLEHYGKKGMKWGVRKKVSGAERRAARKEVRAVGKSARSAIRDSARASSASERKAVADRYERDVLKKVQSKEFKQSYRNANTMGKGEIAVHLLTLGPLAALTLPAVKKQYDQNAALGPNIEVAAAKTVLKTLRSS